MKKEENKKSKKKIIKRVILSVFAVLFAVIIVAVSVLLPKVDKDGYRNIALHAGLSFLKSESSEEVELLKEKIGGFAHGVCHPNENYEQISEANIEWVRFDISHIPYDEEGNLTPGYISYKERAKGYADRGFKVMAITPYPEDYIEAGYDPRTEEGKAKVEEFAEFYAEDLKGIVSAFQITNEMGIEHFTLPLTLQEAADFIGCQLKAMYDVREDIIIGYNLAGTAIYSLAELMQPYHDYCDYVALDLYLGCFENMFKDIWVYDGILRYIWSYTGKPVILNEFGYMGYGEVKTDEQKNEILKSYGFESEEAARKDIFTFINNLPEDFRDHMLSLEYADENELADKLFNTELANHLYREIQGGFQLTDYKHNPDDQARFFTDTIANLKQLDFLCGAIVYCYSDSDACYICGQQDCPIETGWGLVDLNGEPKPAYYAVQEAFSE